MMTDTRETQIICVCFVFVWRLCGVCNNFITKTTSHYELGQTEEKSQDDQQKSTCPDITQV